MFIQWPVLTCLSLTSCLTGLVIYANFRGCDPYITGKIDFPDQILPFFVMKYLGESLLIIRIRLVIDRAMWSLLWISSPISCIL